MFNVIACHAKSTFNYHSAVPYSSGDNSNLQIYCSGLLSLVPSALFPDQLPAFFSNKALINPLYATGPAPNGIQTKLASWHLAAIKSHKTPQGLVETKTKLKGD